MSFFLVVDQFSDEWLWFCSHILMARFHRIRFDALCVADPRKSGKFASQLLESAVQVRRLQVFQKILIFSNIS
jgi:hypothetical protein